MQNKTINNYINNKNVDSGLEDLVMKYPSFDIDMPTLKSTLREVTSEKLRVAMDSNKYGTLRDLNIGYEELVYVQRLENAGLKMSEYQEKMLAFMKDVLPVKMAKDPNMAPVELLRGTASRVVSERVQDCVMEVQFLSALNGFSPHPVTKMELNEKRDNLVATLLIVNNKLPIVAAQIDSNLSEFAFSETYLSLKDDMKNPSSNVKNKVMEFDQQTAEKLFPLELDLLRSKKTKLSTVTP